MKGWHVPLGNLCEDPTCGSWRHVTDPTTVGWSQALAAKIVWSSNESVPETRARIDAALRDGMSTTDEAPETPSQVFERDSYEFDARHDEFRIEVACSNYGKTVCGCEVCQAFCPCLCSQPWFSEWLEEQARGPA
jgi:hypothetical protein